MISAEKEKVKFNKAIDVNEGDKKGNVEKWLSEIEVSMIDTLKKITKESIQDEDIPRRKWVCKWPGQTVLAVNMLRWTKGAEFAILRNKQEDEKRGYFSNLKKFYEFLEHQLKDVVDLVRTDLTSLERMTLGALVVIDVHAKDTIESLVKEGCKSTSEFNWIA